jgi:hypothetical protein
MDIRTISNPFGQDWLEKLKEILPTSERLNISPDRLLIDGSRKALFIAGHKTLKWSKRYIGMTKISLDRNDLKIQTMAPNLIGIIAPLIFILALWIISKSILFGTIATLLLIWLPIYYINDARKQDRFSEQVRDEINMLKQQQEGHLTN